MFNVISRPVLVGSSPYQSRSTVTIAVVRFLGVVRWWFDSDAGGVVFLLLKACAQRFRYALFAFIHTQTYFEYYTLTLRLASLVKKAVIYAYWTKELFDICRENVSHNGDATLGC